mmetsp:Transcript_10889/g.33390  ORF Transcript_10889/g.33390 Transcript_10889/m.33390 type:complete len:677 (+) Transcript_10889:175-2205(+)|eukprot:CAMPEP_0198730436 /NCGR_PEP_ID=MMETSP1475-20131203/24558_1 /TAXON_ID= ORGANISM="Unidentified sp., Strain CCMP1999" /NCGR_SAMPLE_ID=MMETSP1475 /ASSEMBLY_ACC=CAM_ASM_001111 /LENGTH=676 /DNA_ID=CAMNT_0044493241 /DNA_START=101 /DNA_END=2131 /DNA_ORIENTATION=+
MVAEFSFVGGLSPTLTPRQQFAGTAVDTRTARYATGKGVVRMSYNLEPGFQAYTPKDSKDNTTTFLSYNWKPVDKQLFLCEADPDKAIGSIPEKFPEGVYLRNGPNPFTAGKAKYGWFDGSGMIHSVRFQRSEQTGKLNVFYTNRWIRTGFILISELLRRPVLNLTVQAGIRGFIKVFYMILRTWGFSAREYIYSPFSLLGTANTSVSYFPLKQDGKTKNTIIALYDSDAGYEISLTKETTPIWENIVGTTNYNPYKLDHPMSPHPRYCPQYDEMISFGVGLDPIYLLRKRMPVFFVNRDGEVYRRTSVKTSTAVYQHDFVITEHFVVMTDSPSVVNPLNMVLHPIKGTAIMWNSSKKTSFVLLPRVPPEEYVNAKQEGRKPESQGAEILHGDRTRIDDCKSFALPYDKRCFIYHWANGWEEDDKIVMYGAHYKTLNVADFNSNFPPPREDLPDFYQFVIDLKTGTADKFQVFGKDHIVKKLPPQVKTDVDNIVVDFCNTSWKATGQKSKYIYMCYTRPLSHKDELISPDKPDKGWSLGNWQGVLKFNTEDPQDIKAIAYPEKTNGGEVIFVPRRNAQEEDDGWLVGHVTRLEKKDESVTELEEGKPKQQWEYKSYIWLMDAMDMGETKNKHPDDWLSDGVIYSAQLPQRVPWGLHSMFVSDEFMADDDQIKPLFA